MKSEDLQYPIIINALKKMYQKESSLKINYHNIKYEI